MLKRIFPMALVCGLVACAESEPPPQTTEHSALVEVRSSSFSGLRMFKYVPAGLPADAPLVVAMHGCTQSASAYVATGWNELADEWGFAVLYPDASGNNNACFRWFESAQASRGRGEALGISKMVDRMVGDHDIDASRVFVTGLSAGGAMTAVMLGTYPEKFAAGAVMAGLPYRCATTQTEAFTCMFSGKNLSQSQWASLVTNASNHGGPFPRVSIWHGTDDYTVRPFNADALVSQWTGVHGVDDLVDLTGGDGPATQDVFVDADGNAVVERWIIPGMGHGTAVDPSQDCGTAGAYILDAGVCSTYWSATFFGLNPDGPQTDPTTPVDPGEPANPGEPEEPTTPDEPSEPSEPTPVEPDPSPAFECVEYFDSNYDHEQAGRGFVCQGYVCTVGSEDRLGLWNLHYTSWVRETEPGYFEEGRCP